MNALANEWSTGLDGKKKKKSETIIMNFTLMLALTHRNGVKDRHTKRDVNQTHRDRSSDNHTEKLIGMCKVHKIIHLVAFAQQPLICSSHESV